MLDDIPERYLAFLRDHYYSDPALDDQVRVRFVLASYNAGPGNIAKARTRARQMGLDPNRWFRNVELATLKVVSQEPVQYVTNINKYYLLYNLHFRKQDLRAGGGNRPSG